MHTAALFTAVAILTTTVQAQLFAVERFTIDGGGGHSIGQTYEVTGTIGQAEAGTLTGTNYGVAGGFWSPSPDMGGCNPADLVPPLGILDLTDIDAFITSFLSGAATADIALPQGVIDLADIDLFILSFTAGCP